MIILVIFICGSIKIDDESHIHLGKFMACLFFDISGGDWWLSSPVTPRVARGASVRWWRLVRQAESSDGLPWFFFTAGGVWKPRTAPSDSSEGWSLCTGSAARKPGGLKKVWLETLPRPYIRHVSFKSCLSYYTAYGCGQLASWNTFESLLVVVGGFRECGRTQASCWTQRSRIKSPNWLRHVEGKPGKKNRFGVANHGSLQFLQQIHSFNRCFPRVQPQKINLLRWDLLLTTSGHKPAIKFGEPWVSQTRQWIQKAGIVPYPNGLGQAIVSIA